MPRDLPGLYYDPVKNRYFPVKARGAPSTAAPARSNQPEPSSESEICNRNYIKTLKLLDGRELHGRFCITRSKKLNFQQQYQISQASAPTIWKYRSTDGIVDSSMEHFTCFVQTPQGQKRTGILAMGSMSGSISIYEVGKFGHLGFGTVRTPVCLRAHRAIEDGERPECIRACEGYAIPLFSSVSCITRRKKKLSSANDQFSSDHSCALVSSLGSGGSGGSVYMLDFAKSLDIHQDAPSLHSRLVKVASTNCTIWSADSNCDGTRAVIGTNRGAALVHLERRELSWICRTKSDILSLQFDHSGNIVLCGLRNGAIIIVDIRQRQHFNSLDNSSRSWSSMDQKLSNHGLQVSKHLRTWLKGDVRPLGAAFMPSAVCSLASLHSYGHYFLASSMDGSVGLFDSRLLQQGAVHSYEGHVNSHSRLQISVDPTETFFLAGGEDCCMRIWSIKTGKILYGSGISSSPVVAMCWPQNESVLSASDESRPSSGVEFDMEPLELTHSWAAWLGSLEDGGWTLSRIYLLLAYMVLENLDQIPAPHEVAEGWSTKFLMAPALLLSLDSRCSVITTFLNQASGVLSLLTGAFQPRAMKLAIRCIMDCEKGSSCCFGESLKTSSSTHRYRNLFGLRWDLTSNVNEMDGWQQIL